MLRLSKEEIDKLNKYFDKSQQFDIIFRNKLSTTIKGILQFLNPSVSDDEIFNNSIYKRQYDRETAWNNESCVKMNKSSPHLMIFGTGAGKPSLHRKNASILFDYGNMHMLCDVGCDWFEDLCVNRSINEAELVFL